MNLVKSVDIKQEFMDTLYREISDRFMYEPKNEDTLRKIENCVVGAIKNNYPNVVIQNVNIDFMQDLELKYSDCRACAETSSYEEYKLKCAALNKPDAAGSNGEWFRMSRYSPGSILINVNFVPAPTVQNIEITTKIY